MRLPAIITRFPRHGGRQVLALVVVLVPAALSMDAVHATARSVSCSGTSPQGVVRSYYGALAHHRAAAAKACLMPYYGAQLTRVVDPDWENVVTVRVLSLRTSRVSDRALPGNVPAAYAKPYAAAQVAAEIVVHFRRIGGSPNGKNLVFIYAVKQHRSSSWRIMAMGSGP